MTKQRKHKVKIVAEPITSCNQLIEFVRTEKARHVDKGRDWSYWHKCVMGDLCTRLSQPVNGLSENVQNEYILDNPHMREMCSLAQSLVVPKSCVFGHDLELTHLEHIKYTRSAFDKCLFLIYDKGMSDEEKILARLEILKSRLKHTNTAYLLQRFLEDVVYGWSPCAARLRHTGFSHEGLPRADLLQELDHVIDLEMTRGGQLKREIKRVLKAHGF